MAWHDDPRHPFAGIANKLERTDENILNLHSEIVRFFQECKYPIIPNPNDKAAWRDAVAYHKTLEIPIRFSVLGGEIVHHLRSCLDHIVWHFSSPTARRDHPNLLEFPVFPEAITNKTKSRYEGKVQGITNAGVRSLIDSLQPYHRGADAANDPLCIIHDLDRFDKHRELVLVTTSAQIRFQAGTRVDIVQKALAYTQGEAVPRDVLAAIGAEIKKNHQVTPNVAFAQVGKWKTQPVVPALAQLRTAIEDVVGKFAALV